MYSVSVIPTAAVPRVGKNQVITPPPAAPPLLAPVTCYPSIRMARVSVRTRLDPAMPVAAVGDVMLPLQLLRQLHVVVSVFLCQIFTELRHSAGRSQDTGVVMVGAHIIAPTARGMACPPFLPSPLGSCTRPLPAVAVHRRLYHGDFVDAEPVGVSSSSCPDISSSSLSVQRLFVVL